MTDVLSEFARIDRPDHLTEDPRGLIPDHPVWMKARRTHRLRSRADDYGREREQVVGLNDHRKAATALEATAAVRQVDRVNRLALIEREFPGTARRLREHELSESVSLSDLLDAYAVLWTALRVASGVVHPERDALGSDASGRCPDAGGLLLRIVA